MSGTLAIRDEELMRLALAQAQRAVGRTAPNPPVGAVVVKAGKVVGRGFTAPVGGPHAEVRAIEDAGRAAKGGEIFTTLEPCAHYGKTPPCSEAILTAGIKRVVYASSDPNPLVNGKGVRKLKKAGVEVVAGVLKAEGDEVNGPFLKLMRTGRPFVTLKAAITLDGKLATATGDSKWISGDASRARVHELRNRVDAILVGAGTVESDDPSLTTRGVIGGRDALRVVLDSTLRTQGKIYKQKSAAKTVVATLDMPQYPRADQLQAKGVEIWKLPGRSGRIALKPLLDRLGERGLLHVLVEGGSTVFGSFLAAGLWDELWLFVAPKLFGHAGVTFSGLLAVSEAGKAEPLRMTSVERVDEDLLIKVRPVAPRR